MRRRLRLTSAAPVTDEGWPAGRPAAPLFHPAPRALHAPYPRSSGCRTARPGRGRKATFPPPIGGKVAFLQLPWAPGTRPPRGVVERDLPHGGEVVEVWGTQWAGSRGGCGAARRAPPRVSVPVGCRRRSCSPRQTCPRRWQPIRRRGGDRCHCPEATLSLLPMISRSEVPAGRLCRPLSNLRWTCGVLCHVGAMCDATAVSS